MEKQIYVSSLKSEQMLGEEFEELFMIKDAKFSKSLSNKWCNLVLFDKTGELPGIIFGEDAVKAEKLKGSIVKARGLVTLFNGECRATVKSVVLPAETEKVSLSEFVPGLSKEELAGLFTRLNNLLGQIAQDAPLLCLVRSVYQKYGKDFMSLPGGYMHHRYAGGLLAHSVETAEMAALICDQQKNFYDGSTQVNKMLVIAGALLHDIGKVFEFEVFPFGVKKKNAPLINYKIRGPIMVTEVVKAIISAYPDTKAKWETELPILCNITLSAHKKNDEPPRTKEARIVQLADISSADTDACAYEEAKVNQDNPEGGYFYSRYFGCNMKSSGLEEVV